jgi:hypothetical protein
MLAQLRRGFEYGQEGPEVVGKAVGKVPREGLSQVLARQAGSWRRDLSLVGPLVEKIPRRSPAGKRQWVGKWQGGP